VPCYGAAALRDPALQQRHLLCLSILDPYALAGRRARAWKGVGPREKLRFGGGLQPRLACL